MQRRTGIQDRAVTPWMLMIGPTSGMATERNTNPYAADVPDICGGPHTLRRSLAALGISGTAGVFAVVIAYAVCWVLLRFPAAAGTLIPQNIQNWMLAHDGPAVLGIMTGCLVALRVYHRIRTRFDQVDRAEHKRRKLAERAAETQLQRTRGRD